MKLNTPRLPVALITALIALLAVNTASILYGQRLRAEQASALAEKHEADLERIHSVGYDQGYLDAVWDGHFGILKYQIQEGGDGEPTLWKKQVIDPTNAKRFPEPPAPNQPREN